MEQRETLLRLIPKVIQSGKAEEVHLVGHLFFGTPTKERYAVLEKIGFGCSGASRTRKTRTMRRYITEARSSPGGQSKLEEEAALTAYLDRLERSKNAELREASAETKRRVANELKPPPRDKRETTPEGLVLGSVEFVLEKGGRHIEQVHKIVAAGRGVDLVWAAEDLFLMKQKGKLRPLPTIERLNASFNAAVITTANMFGQSASSRRGARRSGNY